MSASAASTRYEPRSALTTARWCDAPQQRRRGEEPQRVSRRRRVDDDAIERVARAGGAGQADDLDQSHHLVDAGQRQLQQFRDVLVVEVRPANRYRRDQVAPRRQPSLECALRIHVGGIELPRARNRLWFRADRNIEHRREGRHWIGGHEEGARVRRGIDRRHRRVRRLPDTPLAADERKARQLRSASGR
jgi:hypothetical protein